MTHESLLQEMPRTTDPAKLRALADQVQGILATDVSKVLLVRPDDLIGTSKTLVIPRFESISQLMTTTKDWYFQQ